MEAINVTIRNTFLEIKLDNAKAAAAPQRSSSLPRAFKPGEIGDYASDDDDCTSTTDIGSICTITDIGSITDIGCLESIRTAPSEFDYQTSLKDLDDAADVSTRASECGCWADYEIFDSSCDGDNSECDNEDKNKVTLNLVDMVQADTPVRSKLRLKAQPFQSGLEPPDEVKQVISRMTDVLGMYKCDVQDIQVQNGCMGGTTMVVCQVCNPLNSASVLWSAKQTLLTAAAESENTYIMGYNTEPFKDLDALSFSASIGCIPSAHQDTACWDTYEKGFCPRCACGQTCRWEHPSEVDIIRCVVTLKETS